MNTFFTSDTHFGHNNIIKYTKRPFTDSREMDEAIITRWNEVVTAKDEVYHLGDFSLAGPDFVRRVFLRLNGHIKVLGYHWHHDKRWLPQGFGRSPFMSSGGVPVQILPPMVVLSFKHLKNKGRPQVIALSHYAMAKWDRSHHGSWHLYGHSHGVYENGGLSMDVGVDCNDFRPFSLDEIAKVMQAREEQRTLDVRGKTYNVLPSFDKDVHTEHCCKEHGCKYGRDERCSVASGAKPQSFPCTETSVCWDQKDA